MQSLIRFAVLIAFFGVLLLSLERVGNSAPQGLTLTVTEPTDRSYTNQSKAMVAGSVNTDDATVTANGTELVVAPDHTFRGQVSLPNEGPNPIEIRATVGAKSVVTVTRTVIRDTIAPSLSIAQPVEGATINAPQVEIRGSAADAGPFTITVDGIPVKIVGGKDALWLGTVPLTTGFNDLRVRGIDAAGNQTEVIRRVFRPGGQPLSLQLDEPAERKISKSTEIFILGSVAGENVTMTANDTPLTVAGDGSFFGSISLSEGTRSIKVVARDGSGNQQEATRTVIVDSTPPVITGLQPPSGTLIPGTTALIIGRVNDQTRVKLSVQGVSTTVPACLQETPCGFLLPNIPIHDGENQLTIFAEDEAGNSTFAQLRLVGKDRTPPATPTIFPVTTPTRLQWQSIGGKAEPGAQVAIRKGTETTQVQAGQASGLFYAQVSLTEGANAFSATATDPSGNVSSPVSFNIVSTPSLQPPPPGQAWQINVASGSAQQGLINAELPRPLVAVVTDTAGTPVPGVPVTFTVTAGGGRFVGGAGTFTATTNSQGYAIARLITGNAPGIQNIWADFGGNTALPTSFFAKTFNPPAANPTRVTGQVFDQNQRPLPNVIVRLGGQQTRTGSDGGFSLANVATGPNQVLELIGRDQVPFPGRWPNISFDLDVIPGLNNSLRRPLFLPRVNDGIQLPLDAGNTVTQDTSVELPVLGDEPPVRITARTGTQVTFPPDVTDRRLSVTRIPVNQVPMTLEDGRFTSLYLSIQPQGAIFDPPLELSMPNIDHLPANSPVLVMSFDHDAGRYVRVGSGHVSADGKSVFSDPGSGIRIGAWHGAPAPSPPPDTNFGGGPLPGGEPPGDDDDGSGDGSCGPPPISSRTNSFPRTGAEFCFFCASSVPPYNLTCEPGGNCYGVLPSSLGDSAANVMCRQEPEPPKVTVDKEMIVLDGSQMTADRAQVTATGNTLDPPGVFTWEAVDDSDVVGAIVPLDPPTNNPNRVLLIVGKSGKGKVRVTYTSGGKSDQKEITVYTVGGTLFKETGPCTIDDGMGQAKGDPAIFIETGKTRTVLAGPGFFKNRKFEFDPKVAELVSFESGDSAVASIMPTEASTAPEMLKITGVKEGETAIKLMVKDGPKLTKRLTVRIGPKIMKTVALHVIIEENDDEQAIMVGQGPGPGHPDEVCVRPGKNGRRDTVPQGDDTFSGEVIAVGPNGICDTPANKTNGPTPLNVPKPADLEKYLNEVIWGTQAGVYLKVTGIQSHIVNYDFDLNGKMGDPYAVSKTMAELNAISVAAISSSADINIYFVQNIEKGFGFTLNARRETWIQEIHLNSVENIAAHEIGHSLGIGNESQNDQDVMYTTPDPKNPCIVRKVDWDQIRSKK